jgi:hypothetical protein
MLEESALKLASREKWAMVVKIEEYKYYQSSEKKASVRGGYFDRAGNR